jgi:hypothetical protein
MGAAVYLFLGLGGIGLVYLMYRFPQLAGATFLLAAAAAATVLLLQ